MIRIYRQAESFPTHTAGPMGPHWRDRSKWPPGLDARTDPDDPYDPDAHIFNTTKSAHHGPIMHEDDAKKAGWVGPFYHGTTKRRAQQIQRNGFRQPRLTNEEMKDPGTAEEVDFGHTHRTFFAEKEEDARHFAQGGDKNNKDVAVVKAYLHPDHIERDSAGGFMPGVTVKDVNHAAVVSGPHAQMRKNHIAGWTHASN